MGEDHHSGLAHCLNYQTSTMASGLKGEKFISAANPNASNKKQNRMLLLNLGLNNWLNSIPQHPQ